MPEWWTYGLSDFLLFSPRTYYRLIERYNVSVWPAHVLTIGLGLGMLWALLRPRPGRSRAVAAALAALWVWVGWAFVWRRYAEINWAAAYLVWLYALEAVLLGWMGVVRGRLTLRSPADVAGTIGIALLALSVVLYPLLAVLAGRSWRHSEVFGVAPEPTVIGTLGILLLAEPRRMLLAAPLLLAAIGSATLWALGSPERWVVLASLALVILGLRRGSSSRAAPGTGDARAAARTGTTP